MRQVVVMPGGFHPFHAGHAALYKSAVDAFTDADVYVAATNDTKTRPFPFSIKEKLAKLAGVADKHFVQVKSPFKAEEITQHYNPNEDVLIFVRSEKDKTEQPKPGGTKKDGSPAYFQPWTGKNLQPFSKHAYIAYLPTVEFGPGITSATEIRNAWPTLNDKRKTAMVMSLYPVTQKNPKLAANVVKDLDMGMGTELAEAKRKKKKKSSKSLRGYFFPGYAYYGGYGGEGGGDGGDGGGGEGKIKEGDTARVFHPQYVDVYYLDGPRRTPILVNRKVPYNLVDRYLELAIKKYNLQQGRFEFRNAEEEKVAEDALKDPNTDIRQWAKNILTKVGNAHFIDDRKNNRIVARGRDEKILGVFNRTTNKPNTFIEGMGIPYPTTYEQENNKFKRRGPMRITNMTEFAPPGSNDREPDEEEILRQLAAEWWNGSIQQMKKAQQTLQAMGWEIGQDESGDDDAGVFVIRIGDVNGDSYIAFPHSALGLNEDYLNEK